MKFRLALTLVVTGAGAYAFLGGDPPEHSNICTAPSDAVRDLGAATLSAAQVEQLIHEPAPEVDSLNPSLGNLLQVPGQKLIVVRPETLVGPVKPYALTYNELSSAADGLASALSASSNGQALVMVQAPATPGMLTGSMHVDVGIVACP